MKASHENFDILAFVVLYIGKASCWIDPKNESACLTPKGIFQLFDLVIIHDGKLQLTFYSQVGNIVVKPNNLIKCALQV
jgi:hypothetical protein